MVYSGTEEKALQAKVNEDLSTYQNWLYSNRLKINIDKTKYMIFKQKNKNVGQIDVTINNLRIEEVKQIKYLGLIIDNSLNWSQHVQHVINKITPMLPIIYRCRDYLTNKSKNNLYNAFFLSHLRYLIPIWGTCGKTLFSSIINIQNKILKILFNYNRLSNTDALYIDLGDPRVNTILELDQIKLMYRIIHKDQKSNINILFNNDVHSYTTRSQNNIYCYNLGTRTNIGLNDPLYQASKIYNTLPENIRNFKKFKTFVRLVEQFLGII